MDRPPDRRSNLFAIALFAVIALSIGGDAAFDFQHGAGIDHILMEISVTGLAVVGAVVFTVRLRRQAAVLGERAEVAEQQAETWRGEAEQLRGEADSLRDHLADVRAEAERWRAEAKEALDGLGVAIDAQFERWSLSSAEREVGLLLLKGLSHQEIADVRGVSERTARQQARAVYKKAGLSGRAELSAYFLEDLLLPQDQARRG